ncbi:MAG: glycosyltransferase [Planctomycetota bacterium]
MRLALLTQHFAPHFEGGTEALVRAQAREFARRGVDVTIIAGTDRPHRGVDVETAEVDGLRVSFVPRLPSEPYDLVLERPRVARLVAELAAEADLVHLHHHSTLDGGLVRELRAGGRPVVVTLHDLFVTCPRFFRVPPDAALSCGARDEFEPCVPCIAPDAGDTPEAALLAGLRARARGMQAELDAAALVCVPSATHAERLRRLVRLETSRLVVVPNGLTSPLERVVTSGWEAAREPLRVLFLGHLAEVKGVEDVAVATRGLANVELHCLGKAVDPAVAERLRAAGAHLHGEYAASELAARVAALRPHLAVIPSRAYESYGLTLDEAHALGLPAWVGDRGALGERVGAAGRVLPARDPAAWRAALLALFDEPAALEAERLAVPRELPGPEASAARLLAEYDRLADASTPR